MFYYYLKVYTEENFNNISTRNILLYMYLDFLSKGMKSQ